MWPNNKSIRGTSTAVRERRGQKWFSLQGKWVAREDSRRADTGGKAPYSKSPKAAEHMVYARALRLLGWGREREREVERMFV